MSKFVKEAEEVKKQLAMAQREIHHARTTLAKTNRGIEAARAGINKSHNALMKTFPFYVKFLEGPLIDKNYIWFQLLLRRKISLRS